jgi:uncharacterized membrane protein YphA (DoxX/SURF4 family)/mannose-6-phosphate isomerase-like protein (cupin superfamily)
LPGEASNNSPPTLANSTRGHRQYSSRPSRGFVTIAEIVFGIALLLGLRTREVALASDVLLGLFALGLAVGTGLKSALNYSVFAASTGALALATERSYRWSLDALLASRARGEGERAAGRRQQREYTCRKDVVHPATRTEGLAMMDVILKRFEAPDETRVLTKGKYEIVRRGGMTIGCATYEPGWKWSSHIGPSVGASHCTVEHVGLVLSGTATAAFADGRVTELRAGELFYIPGVPHDSWVIRDEPYVSLHFIGADHYAK